MTVHAPVVRAPVHVPHVPAFAVGLVVLAIAVLVIGALVLTLQPAATPTVGFTADEVQQAYNTYRQDERATLPVTSEQLQQLWNDFRQEERNFAP